MRTSNYHYNPETCQYEPATLRLKNVVWYGLGLLVMGALMFTGLVVAYDRLTETELEAALRKENRALDKHQTLLVNQLTSVESTLQQLKEKDQSLYQKLFEETSIDVNTTSNGTKSILLADASNFTSILDNLNAKSTGLLNKSLSTNEKFGNNIHVSKRDIEVLNSIPTLQPITNPNLDLLVSGFGTRINPFHKGKYKHAGIDFAAPRGTEVFATAPGRIIDINRSDLQAGYGNSIEIDHGHGFITSYSHLDEINVKVGQRVTKGMRVGTVGNSGGSIAPHLHYEVIHQRENVDPLVYMIEGLNSYEYNRLLSISKKQNQSLD